MLVISFPLACLITELDSITQLSLFSAGIRYYFMQWSRHCGTLKSIKSSRLYCGAYQDKG